MTRARWLTWFVPALVATACGTGASLEPGAPTATPGPTARTPVAPSPSATSAPSPLAPLDGEWIVYQWLEGDGDGIFVMRPDGSEAHSLGLKPAGRLAHPDWSHDGTRIAYEVATSADGEDVWIADANGANAELAAAADCPAGCLDVNFPAWSPDDGSMALVRIVLVDGVVGSTLDVVDLATGEVRILYTSPALSIINYPRWSRDGASIVFEMTTYPDASLGIGTATGSALWVIGLNGGEPRRLTEPSLFATYPDWSPVGDAIAFSTYDLGEFQATREPSNLYLVNADGSGLKQLTALPRDDLRLTQPSWTPDGSRLIFTLVGTDSFGGFDGPRSVGFIDADGTDLVTVDQFATHPRLRPAP
jgi:Tol biopolymer transport system component